MGAIRVAGGIWWSIWRFRWADTQKRVPTNLD